MNETNIRATDQSQATKYPDNLYTHDRRVSKSDTSVIKVINGDIVYWTKGYQQDQCGRRTSTLSYRILVNLVI